MSEITGKAVPSDIIIGTDGKKNIKLKAHGKSFINLPGGKKPDTLSRVPHAADVEHSLASVSRLCDDNHTVRFEKCKCVVRKDNCVVGLRESADRLYFVDIQRAIDKEMVTADVPGDRLSVWHIKLAHADRKATRRIA